MEKTNLSNAYLRKRKFLLVSPLLVLPFVTLFFWALGGGKLTAEVKQHQVSKGLNTSLPEAKLKDEKGYNKLSFYDEASKDSARVLDEMKNDPYSRVPVTTQSLNDSSANAIEDIAKRSGFQPDGEKPEI